MSNLAETTPKLQGPPETSPDAQVTFGVYLDLLRVAAAGAVLMCHFLPAFNLSAPAPSYGHDAVIIFFVLSGFVIAAVCDSREPRVGSYVVSRLVRLWSAAIPALLLGLLLHLWLPDRSGGGWGLAAGSSVMSLFFLAEGWAGSWHPPFNGPFWSLNYEAWYYGIYACLVFAVGPWRWVLFCAALILSGPGIIALAPCWFAGVILYHRRHQLALSVSMAWLAFIGSIVVYFAFGYYDVADLSRAWLKQVSSGHSYRLGAAQALLADWLLTLVVMVNFAAAASLPALARILLPVRQSIAWAASFTLSIYLYHSPMLALCQNGFGLTSDRGVAGFVTALFVTMILIFGLALVTEQRRYQIKRALGSVLP